MSSIDERVVEMKFNNSQFQKGVADTSKSLGDLKKNLDLKGAAKSIGDLDAAGKKFSLAGMADGIQGLASKFTALSVVGVTALATIANKAVNAGLQMAKSLTIAPINDGFAEYELKMGSIQTILANTARHGTGLKEVTDSLDSLNEYADKTIYNFGDMTKNIGLFTNAGLKVDEATSMIKGFSNEAAASGTSSQGAAGAAYQLSQALSAGTIRLMDWRSLSNVGMGNKNMQNGIIEIADAMGTLETSGVSATEVQNDFTGSLEKKWLSADVMSTYLKIMAGDMDDAAMSSLGLTDTQIDGFKKSAKTAQEAAQKVRTFTQMIGTLKEGVGSGWAQTFDILVGDFDEATEMWSGASSVLEDMVGQMSDARNNLLTSWDKLGGRDLAIQAVSDAFKALMAIIKPIKDAFTDIFPPMTGKQLYTITAAIAEVAKNMMIGKDAAENLKRTFRGVFAVLDIGWMIIKGLGGVLLDLIGVIFQGSGGFLEFTGSIGDFLVSIRDAIKNGEGLTTFFETLGNVLKVPIKILQALGKALGSIFSSDAVGGAGDAVSGMVQDFNPLVAIGEFLMKLWEGVVSVLQTVGGWIRPLGSMIGDFLGDWGTQIGEAMSNMDFDSVLNLVNTGLFAGLVLMFKNFLGGGGMIDQIKDLFKKGDGDEGGGLVDTIKGVFGSLTDTLSAMQMNLKAGTLIKIAGAIALLTASVVALSFVDAEDLTKSLTAISVMFIQLGFAMMLFEKVAIGKGWLKMPLVAGSMILLSVAILILASAVKKLADLDWEELAKGLVGVGGLLASLALFTKFAKTSKGAVAQSAGLILLGIAINILAKAVEKFAKMEWQELAKGVSTLGGVLLLLAGFSKLTKGGGGLIAAGVAIIAISFALEKLAPVLKEFGDMSWEEIAKGIVTLAGSLLTLSLTMRLMQGTVLGAAALVIVVKALEMLTPVLQDYSSMDWEEIAKGLVMLAGSLLILAGGMYLMTAALPGAAAMVVAASAIRILAPALEELGNMDWEEIAKALVALAGSLLILAGGMYLMTAALPGAAALLVVTFALKMLAPVLVMLGEMTWGEIGRGLVALAGALTVLGIAGILILPAIPGLILLGVALTLLGTAIFLAGIGMVAFSIAFVTMATAIATGGALMLGSVKALLGLIPFAMEQIGLGIIALIEAIANNQVAIIESFVKIGTAILTAINTMAPDIIDTIMNLLWKLISTIVEYQPKFERAGRQIIINFLLGLAADMNGITTAGKEVIVAFLNGIQEQDDEIAQEGAETVISFVNAVSAAIENNTDDMEAAGGRLAKAIADGMSGGLISKAEGVARDAWALGKRAIAAIEGAIDSNSPSKEARYLGEFTGDGLALGMVNRQSDVAKAGDGLGHTALDSMKSAMSTMSTMVNDSMDSAPTIRPVLDLSDVQKNAGLISGMMGGQTIDPDVSRGRANTIFDLQSEQKKDELGIATDTMLRGVNFVQNNYSPKALSDVEIYRQTKNQLSVAKGALNS